MSKTQAEQNLYNRLLITQAINYQKLGYCNIKVNNQNCINGQPIKVGGFTPDLSAVFDDETTLCEVVTNDTMNETQQIEKWRALSHIGCDFHMITLKKFLNELKGFTKDNGIIVTKYWYSKSC